VNGRSSRSNGAELVIFEPTISVALPRGIAPWIGKDFRSFRVEGKRKKVRRTMEINHIELFALVKAALKGLATDKSAPHGQRMREIEEIRNDCNVYMEATCACALAHALK
jgi:hypothetical protein